MGDKRMSDIERANLSPNGVWIVHRPTTRCRSWSLLFVGLVAILTFGTNIYVTYSGTLHSRHVVRVPDNAAAIKARCENLKFEPGPPPGFSNRTSSDRFVPGTKAILIKNATIWTGNDNGNEVLKGDIFLNNGLIKAVGSAVDIGQSTEIAVVDAQGGWVTPGIVDLHSHLAVNSLPRLSGASDTNSRQGIVQPWLRSLDGLNTHDDAYKLSIAGGVTTSQILPGSANDIGGQAFIIKLRSTAERTPTSMLLEPPFTLNRTEQIDMTLPPRWRHIKYACGENPAGVYGNVRMDNIWAFREIYDTARQIKESQDAFCERALADDWEGLGAFPEELQYEALVDVLRGRVKVQVHCYEAVDFDDIVRLTNEFEFPIAAFHHAHETYLVPDLLKQAFGNTPASAMFAVHGRYKREAYRGSEFAPRILADNGLPVVMKSDHPVLNGRHLLFEAQQAHYYGLSDNLALASVTSTSSRFMGMDHRIGFIRTGYDADIVLWDSHPLTLGAIPRQVFIDGIAQFDDTYAPPELKADKFQEPPETPNFDQEAKDAVKFEGLPPLEPEQSVTETVIFTNITRLTVRSSNRDGIVNAFDADVSGEQGVVVAQAGRVVCAGLYGSCSRYSVKSAPITVDLKGGAISPGLISFGSSLGLEEIDQEPSTQDGSIFNPFDGDVPSILGGNTLIRAQDGLQFATRHAYLAFRAGTTIGVTPPSGGGFLNGLSTAFSLGSAHKLEEGAIVQDVTAVHVSIGPSVSGSVSTQVAALRRLLLDPPKEEAGKWFKEVANGKRTLVAQAQSADVISTLVQLKKEVENATGKPLQLTIASASEAHLLASELAEANVGVIIAPSRPFPDTWERRRILPGPPITESTAISLLLAHNVTVGIGVEDPDFARNTRFDAAWAALEVPGQITRSQAFALASTNLEKILGLNIDPDLSDLVATEKGDLLDFESKVVGVIAPRKGTVDLF